jgi:hypothetical protein
MKKRIGITVRFTVEDYELIQEFTKRYDISESDLIRMAVKEYLKNHMEKQKEVS